MNNIQDNPNIGLKITSFQEVIVFTNTVGYTFNLVYAFYVCQHNLSVEVWGMTFLTTWVKQIQFSIYNAFYKRKR